MKTNPKQLDSLLLLLRIGEAQRGINFYLQFLLELKLRQISEKN